MFKIELGVKVESLITGLKGTVTARSENLNTNNTYWVVPKVDKDGKAQKGCWIDESELFIIENVKKEKENV